VTTLTIPGLGSPEGMFLLADGTRLFSSGHTIVQFSPSDSLATIVGYPQEGTLKDGQGIFARFNCPDGLTVDRAGNVVFADYHNHAIRSVTKEGVVVSTLSGGRLDNYDLLQRLLGDDENDEENDEEVLADGQGPNARFKLPRGEVVAANGDITSCARSWAGR
jgi:hypothetical protein